MKVGNAVSAVALLAALGGGYAVKTATGPGTVGVQDQMEEGVITAATAISSPVESPSPETTPEPVALVPLSECERWAVERLKPVDAWMGLVGAFPDAAPPYLLNPEPLADHKLVRDVERLRRHGTLELLANVEIEVRTANGELKDYQNLGNLIVNGGRTLAVKTLIGDNVGGGVGNCPTIVAGGCGVSGACAAPTKFQYIGIGTNSPPTGDDATLTTLKSEFSGGAYARQLNSTPTFPSAGVGKLQVTFGANNPSTGTVTIAEAGVFNALSVGTLFARRQGFTSTKNASDIYQITWTFTIS